MGILATHNKQLIFIYSENSSLGNRILPYVNSINKSIRLININQEPIADTIWIEIASILNFELKDLFNINSSTELNNFHAGDWLKIINKNPELLQKPIAINGCKAKIIEKEYDIFQFYNATGANFNKAPKAIKLAEHEDTTDYNNAM